MAEKRDIEQSDVQAIIDVFVEDKSFAPRCRKVGKLLKDRLYDISSYYWDYWISMGKFPEMQDPENVEKARIKTAAFIGKRLSDIEGAEWSKFLTRQIMDSCQRGIPPKNVNAASIRTNAYTLKLLGEVYGVEQEDYQDLAAAVLTATGLELSIMAMCHTAYHANQNAARRQEQSAQFESDIGITAHEVADRTAVLRQQAASSSQMANGMLSKASEVAAASEQSAIAMREAAQTAAGLIRAIEDARTEVETAADVATKGAVATDTLSEQSQSIESILGLIRDIAGQTNLLALNATIEAARAGDAGRGFAVVAQEVKSLANQTAQATDEIAQKISSIQSATKASVESNASIRETVDEVRMSAERIRRAMEDQAQTVTMITASVDETALAADLMSNTISAIRSDTENVVSEIMQLEGGFSEVNEKISSLQANATRFVGNLIR